MFTLLATPVAACTYTLEQYEMSDGVIVSGNLYIEVCEWMDDELYIDSMNLNIEDEDGNVIGTWKGDCDKNATLQKVAEAIQNDKRLWGFIYDEAMQAAEDNAAY
jgi:hypothetical protein